MANCSSKISAISLVLFVFFLLKFYPSKVSLKSLLKAKKSATLKGCIFHVFLIDFINQFDVAYCVFIRVNEKHENVKKIAKMFRLCIDSNLFVLRLSIRYLTNSLL